ncbi:MAG: SCO family protein [Acidobacteriia bacterium]|nr:SCO family protein [Terriglobia bacterium]
MTVKHRQSRTWRRAVGVFALVVAVMALGAAGCKKQEQEQEQVRRYHLKGKIVSIDMQQGLATINHENIPGFMDAMTMPYPVRDAHLLQGLGPGDEITADVVVSSDGAYIENIVVTKKGSGAPGKPTTQFHQPQPGEKVPDFALIDQDGKRIHLASYRGDALLVTFIYTRCPFPDFCPLVSKNFASIYAATRGHRPPDSKIRLLSVSFDPAHDTPGVLRRYAETFREATGGNPFDRWQFAVVPAKDLPKVAEFFGLTYSAAGDQIEHSLSTTVIAPNGTVYKWYYGNEWKPADLIEDAKQSLAQPTAQNTGPRAAALLAHA